MAFTGTNWQFYCAECLCFINFWFNALKRRKDIEASDFVNTESGSLPVFANQIIFWSPLGIISSPAYDAEQLLAKLCWIILVNKRAGRCQWRQCLSTRLIQITTLHFLPVHDRSFSSCTALSWVIWLQLSQFHSRISLQTVLLVWQTAHRVTLFLI